MDLFQQAADQMVIYHLRTSWLNIVKLFNERASQNDGTISMAFVLMAIYEEDGVPVTKIAPRIGMEPNSLSRTLNSLEEKKAIIRKPAEEDQRKVLVVLTEEGKRLRKIALRTVFNLEKKITENLSPDELAIFFKVVDSISGTIDTFRTELAKQSS